MIFATEFSRSSTLPQLIKALFYFSSGTTYRALNSPEITMDMFITWLIQ